MFNKARVFSCKMKCLPYFSFLLLQIGTAEITFTKNGDKVFVASSFIMNLGSHKTKIRNNAVFLFFKCKFSAKVVVKSHLGLPNQSRFVSIKVALTVWHCSFLFLNFELFHQQTHQSKKKNIYLTFDSDLYKYKIEIRSKDYF